LNLAEKGEQAVTICTYFEHTCPDFSLGRLYFAKTISTDCIYTNLNETGKDGKGIG